MGTTESIFYDEEQEHEETRSGDGSFSTVAAAAAAAPPAQPRRRRPAPRTLAAVSRPSSSGVASSSNVVRLSGLVLGLSQSGKHTLLQRLQGKDPFAVCADDDDDDGDHSYYSKQTQQQQQQHDDESSSSLSSSRSTAVVVVPYQAPIGQPVWGDKIQLSVQVCQHVHHVIEQQQQQQDAVDFAVVLIQPAMSDANDKIRIYEYLTTTIHALLRLQGYSCSSSNNDDAEQQEDETKTKMTTTNGDSTQHPLCLCLLLNFRDQVSSSQQHSSSQLQLSESDVQTLVMQVLTEYPTIEPDQLVLQCGHVSLKNCYGLDLLHHFMYQAYLQSKKVALQDMLHQLHEAQIQSSRTAPQVAYDDFLKLLLQQQQQQPDADSHHHHHRRRRQAAHSSQPDEHPSGRHSRSSHEKRKHHHKSKEKRRSIVQQQQQQQQVPTRNVLPSSTTTLAPLNARDALEAFLADDDDSDLNDRPAQVLPSDKRQPSSQIGNGNSSDDDDEEEEVFYDESGKRQTIVNSQLLTSTTSSTQTRRQDEPSITKASSQNSNKTPDNTNQIKSEKEHGETGAAVNGTIEQPVGKADSHHRRRQGETYDTPSSHNTTSEEEMTKKTKEKAVKIETDVGVEPVSSDQEDSDHETNRAARQEDVERSEDVAEQSSQRQVASKTSDNTGDENDTEHSEVREDPQSKVLSTRSGSDEEGGSNLDTRDANRSYAGQDLKSARAEVHGADRNDVKDTLVKAEKTASDQPKGYDGDVDDDKEEEEFFVGDETAPRNREASFDEQKASFHQDHTVDTADSSSRSSSSPKPPTPHDDSEEGDDGEDDNSFVEHTHRSFPSKSTRHEEKSSPAGVSTPAMNSADAGIGESAEAGLSAAARAAIAAAQKEAERMMTMDDGDAGTISKKHKKEKKKSKKKKEKKSKSQSKAV